MWPVHTFYCHSISFIEIIELYMYSHSLSSCYSCQVDVTAFDKGDKLMSLYENICPVSHKNAFCSTVILRKLVKYILFLSDHSINQINKCKLL